MNYLDKNKIELISKVIDRLFIISPSKERHYRNDIHQLIRKELGLKSSPPDTILINKILYAKGVKRIVRQGYFWLININLATDYDVFTQAGTSVHDTAETKEI